FICTPLTSVPRAFTGVIWGLIRLSGTGPSVNLLFTTPAGINALGRDTVPHRALRAADPGGPRQRDDQWSVALIGIQCRWSHDWHPLTSNSFEVAGSLILTENNSDPPSVRIP